MADEPTQTAPSIIDGGTPTDQEALLAAQVDTIGDNPTEEPAAAAPAEAAAAEPATPAAPAAEPAPPAAEAEPPAAEAEPAAPAAPVDDPPAVDPEPVAPVPAPAAPTPPRDFDAAYAENQRRYDDGEIEGEEFQKTLRALTKEEGAYTARLAIWEERQQTAAQQASHDFNAVAVKWERDNAEFMKNPLRAQAMQQAIEAVDAKTPGLAPAQLFDQAAKIAFEAFGYTAPAATPPVDAAKALAEATAARTPSNVPPTLANSPAAGAIEAPAGNSAYAALDAKDIGSLEDAIARMTPAQRDAYLRDAPGANSTGA